MTTFLQIYTWCSSVNIKKSLLNYFHKRKLSKVPLITDFCDEILQQCNKTPWATILLCQLKIRTRQASSHFSR